MRKLIELLLGIDPAPWADGGGWRLQWLALPRHGWALVLLLALAAGAWGVLYLYRREGRNLATPPRLMLASLRMIVLLGALAMLLEPVLVFSKEEFVPSTLLVLSDRSQSMDLQDAYVDPDRAAALAAALKLAGPDDLRALTRAQLAARLMDTTLADRLAADGARVVRTLPFATQLLPDNFPAASSPSATRPATSPATRSVADVSAVATATATASAAGASTSSPSSSTATDSAPATSSARRRTHRRR